jgi:short-subunit dehydrogenase
MPHPVDDGVVLITGASSGIGTALARLLAPRAKAIALVARRRDRLDQLGRELEALRPGLRARAFACDLVDLHACERMVREVEAELGPVDVLVNNAGFGDVGVYDRADWTKTKRMIDLNVTSLAFLTHRVLRGMVERGRGGILNVSSGFGLTFLPGLAAYIGTKHFVSGFSESLRLDLVGTGVVVTQVCPGPVRTEFLEVAGNPVGRDPPRFLEISAEQCAREALRAFLRRRALVIPGLWMRLLIPLGMYTPRWILRLVYRFLGPALRRRQLAGGGPQG